jgi:CheY-like chemotaxis protein
MKVLTVDDSRMIRTLIQKCLAPLKLEVIEAGDGRAGLGKALDESPDLVILDVNMPVMDGLQMLRELRAREDTKNLPVLILTAESGQNLVIELIRVGIADYIVKPFEEALLVQKVGRILGIEPANALPDADDPGMRKVLVLDDNESILLVARKFLSGVAEVVTTTRPEKALQLASECTPEIVLLDLRADALKVLSALRSDNGMRSSRFVGLATKSMAEEVENARKAGLTEILFKPFDKKNLVRVVVG